MKTDIRSSRFGQVTAAVIGNALEWYDFVVFGFVAGIISKVFFPTQDAYSGLLLTTATFGVGFVMRPFGGIFIGVYADRRGRKAALQLIIGLMALATAMIAFAPSYAVIGIASSLLIVISRMLQGLATGGEFASSTALLIEMAPARRRGFYGSWQMVGQGLALLCGAGMTAYITNVLTEGQLYSWGWRIPFVFGLLIAPVGYWIRNNLVEPEFDRTQVGPDAAWDGAASRSRGLQKQTKAIICGILLTASTTIAFYILIVYMPTFANKTLKIPLDQAFKSQCAAILIMTLITPISGALSDKIGRRPIIQASLVLYFLLLLPLFGWLVAAPDMTRLTITQISLCVVLGMHLGPYASAVAEQFTTSVRSTGMAISYNVAVVVFGGFAQFFVTWMLHVTGSPLTPAYYLLFGAALGVVGSLMLVKTSGKAMPVTGAQKIG